MTTRPEAIRLAEELAAWEFSSSGLCGKAAAELRRLHNEILVYHDDRLKLSNEVDRLRAALGLIASLEQQPAKEKAPQSANCEAPGRINSDHARSADYKAADSVSLETVYETIICWDEGGGKRSRRELARRIVDLYTTPTAAQRQWVSLTDEEIMEVNGIHDDPKEWPEVISEARAIEAKLREKNGGDK